MSTSRSRVAINIYIYIYKYSTPRLRGTNDAAGFVVRIMKARAPPPPPPSPGTGVARSPITAHEARHDALRRLQGSLHRKRGVPRQCAAGRN